MYLKWFYYNFIIICNIYIYIYTYIKYDFSVTLYHIQINSDSMLDAPPMPFSDLLPGRPKYSAGSSEVTSCVPRSTPTTSNHHLFEAKTTDTLILAIFQGSKKCAAQLEPNKWMKIPLLFLGSDICVNVWDRALDCCILARVFPNAHGTS